MSSCHRTWCVELKFHYVIALGPMWMSMCVHEMGERIGCMQRILMGIEKEPWKKPICYLYLTALHGAKLPLIVMCCKSDWLVWYWGILSILTVFTGESDEITAQCTLVFESITAYEVSLTQPLWWRISLLPIAHRKMTSRESREGVCTQIHTQH